MLHGLPFALESGFTRIKNGDAQLVAKILVILTLIDLSSQLILLDEI